MKMFILGMLVMHFLMFLSFQLLEREGQISKYLGAVLCGPILWVAIIYHSLGAWFRKKRREWEYRAIMVDKHNNIYAVKSKYMDAVKVVYGWKLPDGDMGEQMKKEWRDAVKHSWAFPDLSACPHKMWKSYPVADIKACKRASRIYVGNGDSEVVC